MDRIITCPIILLQIELSLGVIDPIHSVISGTYGLRLLNGLQDHFVISSITMIATVTILDITNGLALYLIRRIGSHMNTHVKRLCQKARPMSLTILHEKHKQPKMIHSTAVSAGKSRKIPFTYLCISLLVLLCSITVIILKSQDGHLRKNITTNCTDCHFQGESFLESVFVDIVLKKKMAVLVNQLRSLKKNKL